MSKKTFYITTPIYYPSGKLHIGNTYCTVAADVMARYKKLRGFDVKFLTGTDDHGLKIERAAKTAGVTPLEFVDNIVDMTKHLWKVMNIEYDVFMRTSEDFHVKAVQRIFTALYEKGDIYKGSYEGLYCVECEAFFTKLQAVGGLCPDCGRPIEQIKEEAYFFRLSKYQDALVKHIEENPDFIRPESRKNEMLNNFFKPGLEDVAVTRTSFTWGVPVPFDPKHVIYVWIDALPNYATSLGFMGDDDAEYKKYWPADVHLVGKDILRFHTIIWPAMLLALGEPLPKQIFGTGWLLIDGGKMSKSKSNVVDAIPLAEKYGVDAVRYFLMREVVFGNDGNYTEEALVSRINSDLANDLGNLLSRTVGMMDKYFEGRLPEEHEDTPFDAALAKTAAAAVEKTGVFMDAMAFSDALSEIWALVRRANKYVDETQPWIMAKNEADKPKLARCLYSLAEALRLAAVLVSPVMPGTAEAIFSQLNISDAALKTWESLTFGKLPKHVETAKGPAIFPRIDVKAALGAESPESQATVKKELIPEITIDDFKKVCIKVGVVLECEKITDKLLKSKIKIGNETRQVVSGIAEYYTPQEMVGKSVAVVVNLKPIKLRGVLSEGMILAAGDGKDLKIVTIDGNLESGAVIG